MKRVKLIWDMLTKTPSAERIAVHQLLEAEKSYLENKHNAEYYAHMVQFDLTRIKRLEEFLGYASPAEPAEPAPTSKPVAKRTK